MNIYRYTLDSRDTPIKGLPWKAAAIPSTPQIPLDPSYAADKGGTRIRQFEVTKLILSQPEPTPSGVGMEEKPTVLIVLLVTWLFWFLLFLVVGV